MHFRIISELSQVETIATGTGIDKREFKIKQILET